MLSLSELPEHLTRLHRESLRHSRALLPAFERVGRVEVLEARADACEAFGGASLYIEDGVLRCSEQGKLVRLYGEGDIVDAHWEPDAAMSLTGDFATRLRVADPADIDAAVAGNPDWAAAQRAHARLQQQILRGLCAVFVTEHVEPTTEFTRATAGEAILREGDEAAEIFVLLSGEASVLVNGVEVGAVYENQVFGEMGFFTNQRRTATVVARGECLLQKISHDEFERLIVTRPQLMTNLLRTMAERMVALNVKHTAP